MEGEVLGPRMVVVVVVVVVVEREGTGVVGHMCGLPFEGLLWFWGF